MRRDVKKIAAAWNLITLLGPFLTIRLLITRPKEMGSYEPMGKEDPRTTLDHHVRQPLPAVFTDGASTAEVVVAPLGIAAGFLSGLHDKTSWGLGWGKPRSHRLSITMDGSESDGKLATGNAVNEQVNIPKVANSLWLVKLLLLLNVIRFAVLHSGEYGELGTSSLWGRTRSVMGRFLQTNMG